MPDVYHIGAENLPDSTPLLPIMREFKMASLNVTSLIKHVDELRIILSSNPLDVIFINETKR